MRPARSALVAFCVAVLVLAGPGLAGADIAYVVGGSNEFGTLDLPTGNFTPIGTLTLPSTDTIFGMGFTSDGNLYGIDSQGPSHHLWRIDPASAVATDLGGIGQTAIGATARGKLLFALDESNNGLLYTVNPSGPTTRTIGNTPFQGDGLVAFDSSGRLFMGENTFPGDFLWQVDPDTAAATAIGPIGNIIFTGVFSGNTLYGFNPDGIIYSINTDTGQGTPVGAYVLPNGDPIEAAAPAPSTVPEPAGLILMGLGSICLLVYQARRRCTC